MVVSTKTGTNRIVALDLMRGYFILVIASIHLAYYPSLLGSLDGRGQLWVSEAEGFFLISGLLIGIIRRNDIAKIGYTFAVRRMIGRGFKLYIAAILLTFFYLMTAIATNSAGITGAKGGFYLDSSLVSNVWRILSLQYSYGWADFLGYYAAFMFTAPILLALFYKRLWWVVAGISLAIWVLRWSGDFGFLNPFMQWQVYFFCGSIFGYYWYELTNRFQSFRSQVQDQISKTAMTISASTLGLSAVAVLTPAAFAKKDIPAGTLGKLVSHVTKTTSNSMYDLLFLHGRIGLIRPILSILVFAGLFAFTLTFERQIMNTIGKVLLPFGQNSLYVYILQSLFLFLIPYFLLPGNFWINTAIELGLVALIWLSVRRRLFFKIIPR